MKRINIKPVSVNNCWQGKRFKTKVYTNYETELLYRLPPMKIPDGKLHVIYHVGFSNASADLGNMEKPFTDILCKKYGFDDRLIYQFTMLKYVVKKGNEFIEFDILPYESNDFML